MLCVCVRLCPSRTDHHIQHTPYLTLSPSLSLFSVQQGYPTIDDAEKDFDTGTFFMTQLDSYIS